MIWDRSIWTKSKKISLDSIYASYSGEPGRFVPSCRKFLVQNFHEQVPKNQIYDHFAFVAAYLRIWHWSKVRDCASYVLAGVCAERRNELIG
jgi:hypothetical protein